MSAIEEIDLEELIRTQEELSTLLGCPGREQEVAAYLEGRLEGLADRVWRDPLGSVLAVREGSPGGERILLSAHMDEVGFMVSHVEESGFLRVDALGGFDRRVLPAAALQFRADDGAAVHGVVGSIPLHVTAPEQRERVPEIRDLFVDVGARSAAEVEARGLHVGSVGTFDTPFRRLSAGRLLGKAFDNRSACNVLLQALRLLGGAARGGGGVRGGSSAAQSPTVMACFAVQEEASHAGAAVAARALEPTVALVVENTVATDVPDTPPRQVITRLGGGPAITAADRTVLVPQAVLDRLRRAAGAYGLPWQWKKPVYGGTDAGQITRSGAGVPTGVVSVPCRYLHGPAAVLDVADLADTVRLAVAFCMSE